MRASNIYFIEQLAKNRVKHMMQFLFVRSDL